MKNIILLLICVFAFVSMQIPKKPSVLIIGDSVSLGYTPFVIEKLADIADVTRPNANCGSTRIALRDMDKWLGDTAWSVIHFNFGLHDLGYRYANDTNLDKDGVYATPNNGGHLNVSLEEYEANLHKIIARLKRTGAQLIFATTTPVSADLHSYVKDSELPYNAIAIRVMKEEKVLINDLWREIKPQIDSTQIPGNPHFTKKGSQILSVLVSESIQQLIIKK